MLKPSAPCYSLEHNGFYSTNAVLKLGEVNAKTCATRNEAPIAYPSPLTIFTVSSLSALVFGIFLGGDQSWNHAPIPEPFRLSFPAGKLRRRPNACWCTRRNCHRWIWWLLATCKASCLGVVPSQPKAGVSPSKSSAAQPAQFCWDRTRMTHDPCILSILIVLFVQSHENADTEQVKTKIWKKVQMYQNYSKKSAKPYSRPASWPRKPCHPMLPRGVPMWTFGAVNC